MAIVIASGALLVWALIGVFGWIAGCSNNLATRHRDIREGCDSQLSTNLPSPAALAYTLPLTRFTTNKQSIQ